MANDFKRFQVNNATTSTGASGDAGYTVPAGAGSTALESIVIGITLSNTTTTGITGDVFLDGLSGTDTYIVKGASIPAGSSLELIDGGSKIVLVSGDALKVDCDTDNALDVWCSAVDTISE